MSGAPGGGAQPVGGLSIVLQGDTQSFTTAMGAARGELDQTEAEMDAVDGKARALEGAFLAAAAGTTALVAGLAGIVRAGGPVEATFSRVEVLAGATTEEMNAMRDMSSTLGAEMPLTMTEIANSFEQLTRRGLEAEEALAAVESVSQLAVAGGLQMGQAASIATNAMNAFGLEADQVSAVADTLASVASSTAADVSGLGDAMRYAATSANQVGLSVTDLSAAVGTLSDAGLDASTAGTSMDAMLRSLVNPAGKAEEALSELGLTTDDFFDEEGNMRSIGEVATMLDEQMADLSAHERSQLLNQIFNARGARAMGSLIAQSESLNETLQETAYSQAGGAIERLQGLDDEALATRQAQVGFELRPGSTEDVLQQISEQASSQEEAAFMLEAGLAIDSGAAEQLAPQLANAEGSFKDLAASIDEATTSADLAEAAMDNVQGQITYLRGSASALAYEMFQGAAPGISAFLDVAMTAADALGEMPWLLEAMGAGMVVATGASLALTAALGAAIVQIKLQNLAAMSAMDSTYGYAAAQHILSGASRAAAGAQWLMTASTGQLTSALWASRAGSLATAASKMTLTGAVTAAGGAMKGAAVAAKGLLVSLGPLGWIVLGITAAWAAWRAGLFDWLGIGQEADAVVGILTGTIGGLWNIITGVAGATWSFIKVLGRLGGILIKIAALPITLPISLIGAAFRAAGDAAGYFTGFLKRAASPIESTRSHIETIHTAVDRFNERFGGAADRVATFIRVLSLFTAPGLVYWLVRAATGADDLEEKLGPLGGLIQGVADAGNAFVDWAVEGTIGRLNDRLEVWAYRLGVARGVLRGLLNIGSAFASWALSPVLDRINERTAAAKQRFDSFKQGINAAIDPFRRLLAWMQRVIDKVPDLPSKEDIPIIGGLFGGDDQPAAGGAEPGADSQALGKTYASGANAGEGAVESVASSIAETAASYLPSSDADRGPLSNLTEQGRALPETLALGARASEGQVASEMERVAGAAHDAITMPTDILTPEVDDPTINPTVDQPGPVSAPVTPETTVSPTGPIGPGGGGAGAAAAVAGGGQTTAPVTPQQTSRSGPDDSGDGGSDGFDPGPQGPAGPRGPVSVPAPRTGSGDSEGQSSATGQAGQTGQSIDVHITTNVGDVIVDASDAGTPAEVGNAVSEALLNQRMTEFETEVKRVFRKFRDGD
ncbi:phage tail tape measure protein [Halalkalicoccus jeotgali]|uniref:Prophage pi3 protein 14 n=1 Tax=Halalkalicoccus jeotgali (strain DSM 18796 / CECT 7217 / JCM 14584 / KCTC 4019 / B3) TaxID=795797 RepID=D8J9U6_HALJB|nr:phage tail tape measure protein [Halalkalicoccus jeotgali]ADJ14468.1 prophage pi3 protein 14 [Halalkalicoccus jeotgali B3]ELY40182.1 prophage pi3 protein 14 [Halalkalicoccus jeotgali B3]